MQDLISRLEHDIVVHAGDLCVEEVLEWVKSLGGEVYVVRGNMDDLPLPDHVVFDVDGIRVGVVHGHQVYPRGDIPKLTRIAKRMGARILITGHTHRPHYVIHEGVVHVNPGSLTGVWGGGGGSLKPSLAYLIVDDGEVSVTIFEDRAGRVVKIVEERTRL